MPVLVYSDDSIAVVDKPPGLTTMRHPTRRPSSASAARNTCRPLSPTCYRPCSAAPARSVRAVHRIDRDTSGLVVFARTKPAEDQLTDQFKVHSVERRYLALVRGRPETRAIESQLVADRGDGRRGSKLGDEGQRAVTHVKVLEQLGDFALVECRLETGRTHQVRIHLGETGWPLCGERVYDRPMQRRPAAGRERREAAHASRDAARADPSGDERADGMGQSTAAGFQGTVGQAAGGGA